MVKVWDGFIRFFHWSLVLLIATLYFSAEEGLMELHMVSAYSLMALLVTRLVWGIIGSDTAKFSSLFHSPKSAIQSLGKPLEGQHGHPPAGSYMALFFFLVIALQLISGLFTSDDILTEGPLVQYASDDWVSSMSEWHEINFNLLLGAIAIHLIAAVGYLVSGKNLIKSMFTGLCEYRKTDQGQFKPIWQAFAILAVILAVIFFFWGMEPLSSLLPM